MKKHVLLAKQGGLRLIPGLKNEVNVKKKALGEQAALLGAQWANGQIGAKGERKLINGLLPFMPGISGMPGLAESLVRAGGPAFLEAIGMQVAAGEGSGDDDLVLFLVHLLGDHKPAAELKGKAAVPAAELDLEQIKAELGLISKNWAMSFDPDGHYIDITAQPQAPTGISYDGPEAVPRYDEVNVAVIYLEEPKGELSLDAKFICQAPARIARLIELLEVKK